MPETKYRSIETVRHRQKYVGRRGRGPEQNLSALLRESEGSCTPIYCFRPLTTTEHVVVVSIKLIT